MCFYFLFFCWGGGSHDVKGLEGRGICSFLGQMSILCVSHKDSRTFRGCGSMFVDVLSRASIGKFVMQLDLR